MANICLLLLGAPGVGKGTQAKLLMDSFGMCQISTGEILRKEIRNKSSLGEIAKKYINDGLLVPDEYVIKMIDNELCDRNIIFDGFPRTLEQAKALDKILAQKNKKLNIVLNIVLDKEKIVKRLSGRLTCSSCAKSYHVEYDKPSKEGICDLCSSALYQRADDNEESINKRLQEYENKTKPLVEFYKGKNILLDIDGDDEALNIFNNISKIINKEIESYA